MVNRLGRVVGRAKSAVDRATGVRIPTAETTLGVNGLGNFTAGRPTNGCLGIAYSC